MEKYVFIIGNSRSGTTMLASIFGRVSNTLVFKELHYFDLISQPSKTLYSSEKAIELYAKLLCVSKLEPWNLHRYKEFLSKSKKEFSVKGEISNYDIFTSFISNQLRLKNKEVAIEQTPVNSKFAKLISENIPESQFVHIIRDPRDVMLSQKNKWKRNKLGGNMSRKEVIRTYFNHNPFITSFIYKKTLQNVGRQKIFIDSARFIEVKFEDILEDPIVQLKQLFEFTDLHFSENVLSINHTSSSFVANKEKGIDPTRKFAWKNKISQAELVICQSINKKSIIQNKYELITPRLNVLNVLNVLYFLITLLFQLFFVFILNFKSFKKYIARVFNKVNF